MSLEGLEDLYPLSSTQAGMIYHSLAEPGAGIYVGQVCFLLTGAVDRDLMTATWDSLVQRHSILRTTVLWEELEEPLQAVHREVNIPWEHLDWRDMTSQEQTCAFEAWKKNDRKKGFVITEPPLIRMALIKLAEDKQWLIWTSHHALADGWSVSVLIDEMAICYQRIATGSEDDLAPAFAYSRHIAWLREQNMETSEAYWRRYLEGFTTPTTLQTARPTNNNRPAQTHQTMHNNLGVDASRALVDAARRSEVSLYTLLQAAWGIMLHRYSGQEDIVFGVTVSGRPPQLQGIESAVGLFINTLPVRHQFNRNLSTSEWLQQLQSEAAKFLTHQFTPLANLREWSEVPVGTALFDTILVLENYPKHYAKPGRLMTWSVAEVNVVDYSNYGLALAISPGEEIKLKLIFDTGLYNADAVTQMLDDLGCVLEKLAGEPERAVSAMELPSGDCRSRILENWGSGSPLQGDAPDFLQSFSQQVLAKPDSTAVSCGEDWQSYAQLDASSSALAESLLAANVCTGSRIAVCLDRGVEVIGVILAVLKTGAAYIPIDITLPPRRIEYLLQDAGCQLLITQSAVAKELADINVPLLFIDRPSALPTLALPTGSQRAQDLAYVIYTSGSTGQPKGVAVTRRNLAYTTQARQFYYPETPQGFLLLSPVSFDSSVAGIFWTLSCGGNLVVAEKHLEQDMDRLSATIAAHSITHTLCLPSLYQAILDNARTEDLQCLRCIIVAGESLLPAVVKDHREKIPQARLYNEYGPTEATVWCAVFDTTMWQFGLGVPIGKPIPGARIYLLDDRGRPVPSGVTGEIYVGGPGVSAGHLGSTGDSATRFMPNPFHPQDGTQIYATGDLGRYLPSGDIEFIGRYDAQFKIRGHRIELAEIESALCEHHGIDSAVLLAIDNSETASEHMPKDEQLCTSLESIDRSTCERLLAEVENLSDVEVTEWLNRYRQAATENTGAEIHEP